MKLEDVARELTQARIDGQSVGQLSERGVPLTRNDAYGIQELGIQHRLQRGEQRVGFKMGLTSEAKRKQMNLDSPLYGEFTREMMIPDGAAISTGKLIHPKIELELAFFMESGLEGQVDREQVLAACRAVAPAIEILDSRYHRFKYFSLEDVISDNSSSSHFIVGEEVSDFAAIDLANLPMSMSVGGQLAQQGNSKSISGDPVQSVVELCQLLAKRNRSLPPGSIVLAGAATPAMELKLTERTEVVARVEHLGEARVWIGP